MKILFLTHTFPFPLDDGIKLHVYYVLKHLARKNKIFLLSLSESPVSTAHQQEIEKLGITVAGVTVRKIPKSPIARLVNCAFDPIPFFVRQFESKDFQALIAHLIKKEKVDIVTADYLSTAIYRDSFKTIPAVSFAHDAMSMLFFRSAKQEKNPLKRFYLNLQAKKTRSFECEWLAKFDGVAVVSEVDKQYLLSNCPKLKDQKFIVAVNGVDTDYFHPMPELEAKEPTILFRGVLSFFPNHDAAIYFYTEILPKIREKIPNARFIVAGKNPDPIWARYQQQDPGLTVTGFVTDMRTCMAQANVVVCPMRAASGVQNKVLEPMAMAKAIVATPRACEALNLEDGKQISLASDPDAFAQKTIELLLNKTKREALGRHAREYVLARHLWQSNAQEFQKLYQAIQKSN